MAICGFKREVDLGQVWTPDNVAHHMAKVAFRFCDSPPKCILDPASGPATFTKALSSFLQQEVKYISYDIDKRFSKYTEDFLSTLKNSYQVFNRDYLKDEQFKGNIDFLIMNPPYVRQEKIADKDKDYYLKRIEKDFNFSLDRRSNLFVYFLVKAISDIRPNGIISAIIYDALDATQYGKKALYLIDRYCEIVHKEKISTPFDGVLIDATILVLKKRLSPLELSNRVSSPSIPNGFVNLSELASIVRGTGLSRRAIFSASPTDAYYKYSKIFLSKQRNIDGLFFKANEIEQRAYIFENATEIPTQIQKELLKRFKESGVNEIKLTHKFLTSPILFNYYIRNYPRHLLNLNGVPVSDNFYLVEPYSFSHKAAWLLLNTNYYLNRLMDSARSQGNGLKKLQLYEYKNTIVPDWRNLSVKEINKLDKIADNLISSRAESSEIKRSADSVLKSFGIWECIHDYQNA